MGKKNVTAEEARALAALARAAGRVRELQERAKRGTKTRKRVRIESNSSDAPEFFLSMIRDLNVGINGVKHAIMQDGEQAMDCLGHQPDSLTGALIGATNALLKIADSIQNLGSMVHSIQNLVDAVQAINAQPGRIEGCESSS